MKIMVKNIIKKNPSVSIIIPVYNVEKYLEKCMESVIGQTLDSIEIICVNDGSTDGSLSILNKYAQKDERVVVITGPNGGYGHAINKGIEAATGLYIGIVESDDYILPEMFETLFSIALENPDLDMVKSDAIRFINDGEEDDCSRIPVCQSELYNRVITLIDEPDCYNAYMINTTGIYKRELFVRNNIRLNESKGAAYQDNGLWFQLFTCSSKIMFIDKAFYMYRMDRVESSTNCTSFENAMCIFEEWKYIYNILKKYNPEDVEKFKSIYTLRCFGSYYYHFTRVVEEYKLLFLKRFSEELNNLLQEGYLCTDLLNPYQCNDLFQILENPNLFYYKWCNENIQNILEEQIEVYTRSISNKILEKSVICQEEKDEKVKVSVIIPVYNAEKTLQRCLKSVEKQSLNNLEIICIDDGSLDKSLSILLLYAKQDPRIVVRTQINSGAGIARNEGLKIAKGDFVAFMDPDDSYPSDDVLEYLYNSAIKNKVNICGGNTLTIDGEEKKRSEEITFENEGICKYKDWQKSYGYYQFLYKKDFLIEKEIFFPPYRRFQDPPFLVRAMIEAQEFYATDKDVYQYYFDPNHVNWNEEKICDLVRGITDLLKLSKNNGLFRLHYDSIMLLEKNFFERIIKFSNFNNEVIRLLRTAEMEIDVDMFNEYSNKMIAQYKLIVLDRILKDMKSFVPSGYIGPNGFKEYLNLKNECCLLKTQILEIQTAMSYRIGMFFTGGKKKAICRGEWIEIPNLNELGTAFYLDKLKEDKIQLEQIICRMRASKIMKRGLKLTSIFRSSCR